MALTYKRRVIPVDLGEGMTITVNQLRSDAGILLSHEELRQKRSLGTALGSQVTGSEGHPWKSRKRGSLSDVGGNFSTVKQYAIPKPANIVVKGTSGSPLSGSYTVSTYRGSCLPISQIGVGAFAYPPLNTSSASQLDQYGATAFARASPLNSAASVSNLLGELVRDGLPRLPFAAWEEFAHQVRNIARRKPGSIQTVGQMVGDEHLNMEFGLKPAFEDINKFFYAVWSAEQAMSQLERDSGRPVRRRYDFPSKVENSVTTFPHNEWPLIATQNTRYYNAASGWSVVRNRETTVRRWFSGAYTYYIDSGYDSRNTMSRFGLLSKNVFGLNISPDTLWQLAPWSWAIDWFSNTGDVIQNVSQRATDGLIMRYGYLMENTIVKDTYTRTVSPFKTGEPTGTVTLVSEAKVRRRANPFGFGVSWEGLSPKQLSIAAALGLSRS